jgi:hypothetical protein
MAVFPSDTTVVTAGVDGTINVFEYVEKDFGVSMLLYW